MTARAPAIITASFLISLAAMKTEAVKPADSDTVGVAAVIENYIRASGGPALNEIRTEQRKGSLLRYQNGQLPLEVIAKVPGLWRYDQTFAWGDQISCGFDGANAWVADSHSVRAMDLNQLGDMRLLFDPQAPLKIRTWYPEMTVSGNGKIGEKEVTTITGMSADGRTIELVFENESGLLLRAGQIYLEDYRPVGSVIRPHKILLGENDSTHFQMVMQFTDTQHDAVIDDTRFRQPECVLPGTDAPLYTHRTEAGVDVGALDACVGVYQHPTDSSVTYTVTRQDNHLMIKRTGWPRPQEIKPQSDTHYFMEFLNRDFYFVRDTTGLVARLEIGNNGELSAARIK
jgi:hypothetical protein